MSWSCCVVIDTSAGGKTVADPRASLSVNADDGSGDPGLRSWPPKSHTGGDALTGLTAYLVAPP